MISQKMGRTGNKMTSRDPPDYSIFKISNDTEKSPGDLRRLAVTQTLVKKYHLTMS